MAKLIFSEEMIRSFSLPSMALKLSGFWPAGGGVGALVQIPCSAHWVDLSALFGMSSSSVAYAQNAEKKIIQPFRLSGVDVLTADL
jgi:hypothetical protein